MERVFAILNLAPGRNLFGIFGVLGPSGQVEGGGLRRPNAWRIHGAAGHSLEVDTLLAGFRV